MTLLSRHEMPAALLPPVTLTAMLTHQANDNGRKPEPEMSRTDGYLRGGDWGQWGGGLPF